MTATPDRTPAADGATAGNEGAAEPSADDTARAQPVDHLDDTHDFDDDDVAVLQAKVRTAQHHLRQLAEVALGLTAVEDVTALTELVINRGVPVLDADGGAVVVSTPDGQFRLAVCDRLDGAVQTVYGILPGDSPLPACETARTGRRIVLGDRVAGLAFSPLMAQVYTDTARDAWVFVPLRAGRRLLGSLAVSWRHERRFDDAELAVIDAFGALTAQALDRIQATAARTAATAEIRALSESLQRSLLTQPPTTDRLDIAVQYLPAGIVAQVGGDWFDVFGSPDGATFVSVGDVTGHDRAAAAAMAQLRNLLRGIALSDTTATPARLLTQLDRAMHTLAIDELATAVLARLTPPAAPQPAPGPSTAEPSTSEPSTSEPSTAGAGPANPSGGSPVDGRAGSTAAPEWALQWSNAGHLPPAVKHPDGTVQLLQQYGDVPLGLHRDQSAHGAQPPEEDEHGRVTSRGFRADHGHSLPAGSTLVLYTDGLIERRDEHIDDSLTRLTAALSAADGTAREMCDQLTAALLGHVDPTDDVAVLVVRVNDP